MKYTSKKSFDQMVSCWIVSLLKKEWKKKTEKEKRDRREKGAKIRIGKWSENYLNP